MEERRIGIDVGGTFTDAVVLEGSRILAEAKRRTTKPRFMEGVLHALDAVIQTVDVGTVQRVTLSTTVITNTVVEHNEEPTDLYIIPGPGRQIVHDFPVEPTVWQGYTDHRGIITAPAEAILKDSPRAKRAAISAKFSVRNPESETKGADALLQGGYEQVSSGAALSGRLNFPRRTVSAYFNSAVYGIFQRFIKEIKQALVARGITAPLYILKADGGALPAEYLMERPVETVFTGPAASVLGMEALTIVPEGQAVALDMGGTTTDISLWRESKPLMARGGVDIRDYPSAVRSFLVRSVGIGGESAITIQDDGTIAVGPQRLGPSVALGGTVPTLGDALIAAQCASYGDVTAAESAMADLCRSFEEKNGTRLSVAEMAQRVLAAAVAVIQSGIAAAVDEENKRPVYEVKDIVDAKRFVPTNIVAVGGTAASLAPLVASAMNLPLHIPPAAPVANAIGAAVAKEIVDITVRVSTENRQLIIPELGIRTRTACATLADVRRTAAEYLARYAEENGIVGGDYEITYEESVPVVKGWQGVFYSSIVCIQLKAGVSVYVQND